MRTRVQLNSGNPGTECGELNDDSNLVLTGFRFPMPSCNNATEYQEYMIYQQNLRKTQIIYQLARSALLNISLTLQAQWPHG